MELNWSVLGWNLAAVVILMAVGWLASLPGRNVTVVDSLGGLGFVLIAWVTLALADGCPARKWLVAVLTRVWGLRLCAYLSYRNWGKGEDPRYGKWRQASGDGFWIVSLFKVFWLQAVFLWVIALAVPGGVWTLISPIIITLVLLTTTGVPLTERTTIEGRPGHRDYMRRTSTFVPWFPKKEER